MKRGSTLILRSAVILLGLIILSICIFVLFPIISSGEITGPYLPILIGLYIPAIPFFVALYHAMKVLNYIDQNNAFSNKSIHALKRIKYCAIIISIIFAVGLPYIYYAAQVDDAPGVLAIALIIAFASATIATAAGVLQTLVQNAVDIKSENDLTV
jgi:hypothetical protein